MMETLKHYLPWIIGAVIVLYLLKKLSSSSSGGGVALAPQTQLFQTPQTDPYADLRAKGFDALVNLGIAQVQSTTEQAKQTMQAQLGSKALDVQLAQANLYAQSAMASANLQYLTQNTNAQIQQRAIDRYYSARDLNTILGSVNGALGGTFGHQSSVFSGNPGGIYGTPPTF